MTKSSAPPYPKGLGVGVWGRIKGLCSLAPFPKYTQPEVPYDSPV